MTPLYPTFVVYLTTIYGRLSFIRLSSPRRVTFIRMDNSIFQRTELNCVVRNLYNLTVLGIFMTSSYTFNLFTKLRRIFQSVKLFLKLFFQRTYQFFTLIFFYKGKNYFRIYQIFLKLFFSKN